LSFSANPLLLPAPIGQTNDKRHAVDPQLPDSSPSHSKPRLLPPLAFFNLDGRTAGPSHTILCIFPIHQSILSIIASPHRFHDGFSPD